MILWWGKKKQPDPKTGETPVEPLKPGETPASLLDKPVASLDQQLFGNAPIAAEPDLGDDPLGIRKAAERIAAERLALELQQGAIEDREAALQVLNEQINRQRTTMDPADRTAQDILKALIQEQVALRSLLQSHLRPEINRRVSALGDWVETYNHDCATKVRYQTDEALARRDLQCLSP